MSGQVSHDVLRRKVSPPPPAPEDVPITSSRAMRLAVTRAADTSYQMVLNVIGLREEALSLDDMLGALDPDLMLLAIHDADHIVGIAALDLNLRSALIEVQTVGAVLNELPDDRPPTLTDATLAEPLLAAIIAEMAETTLRTPLEGWGEGVTVAGRIQSTRNAGLILPDKSYRVVRMSIDLNVAERQGELVFAMPETRVAQAPPVAAPETANWDEQFRATVNASPVRLKALLHRFKIPLHAAHDLKVGQVLPLQGCQVTSVKMLAHDGRAVATARLGQSGGMRAIRVEAATIPTMEDLAEIGSVGNIGSGDQNMGLSPNGALTEGLASQMTDDTIPDIGSKLPMGDPAMEIGFGTAGSDGEMEMSSGTADDDAAVMPAMAAMPDLDWSDEDL